MSRVSPGGDHREVDSGMPQLVERPLEERTAHTGLLVAGVDGKHLDLTASRGVLVASRTATKLTGRSWIAATHTSVSAAWQTAPTAPA